MSERARVAEEVCKLAEQSATTVSSIQSVIKQVQEAFHNGIKEGVNNNYIQI